MSVLEHALKMLPIITREIRKGGGRMAPFGSKDPGEKLIVTRRHPMAGISREIVCPLCIRTFTTDSPSRQFCTECSPPKAGTVE